MFGTAAWSSIFKSAQGEHVSFGDFIGSYTVNAAAFIVGAGVGNAVTQFVGNFGAISNTISGFAGSYAGCFVSGMGNSLLSGNNIIHAYGDGLKQGLIGGYVGGFIGGMVGGIISLRNEGDFLTGEGITYFFTNKNLNLNDFQGPPKSVTEKSIIESIIKNNYAYDPHNVDLVASTKQPKDVLGGWVFHRGQKNEIIIYRDAFKKAELLDLVVGHEIMHEKFYQWYNQLGYFDFNRQYWSSSYHQHEVIYNWMHETYIGNYINRTSSPWGQSVINFINIWGSPITNPFN